MKHTTVASLFVLCLLPLTLWADASSSSRLEADRKAILTMQGEYRVSFDFEETIPLIKRYRAKPAKRSGGYETVIVVEDSPTKIVLQHILLADSGWVTKHWRQDWVYEAPSRFEFRGKQTWINVPLSDAQTKGKWTQCVYEVSDAPRYCGTGAWTYDQTGNATWTSDKTWRPLPRREYSTRSDYDVMMAINRHTITPWGWTHEQDNSKFAFGRSHAKRDVQQKDHTIVREHGLNSYRKMQRFDFQPAYDYWDKTKGYWATVRKHWDTRLGEAEWLVVNTDVDGMPIIEATFKQADQIKKGETVSANDISDAITKHTSVGDANRMKRHAQKAYDKRLKDEAAKKY